MTWPGSPHNTAFPTARHGGRADRPGGRRRADIPRWAHLYWAQHVTDTLVPAGVPLRFVLLHEADFTLARFWRFGADCVANSSAPFFYFCFSAVLKHPSGHWRQGDGSGGRATRLCYLVCCLSLRAAVACVWLLAPCSSL